MYNFCAKLGYIESWSNVLTGGKEKQKVMTNRFTRRSINIDAENFARCQTLANDLAISISGLIRLLIKQAYEKHMKSLKQDNQSVLTQQ
jgi:macrodomain Ter protein organizer (MatP/YcbG family)